MVRSNNGFGGVILLTLALGLALALPYAFYPTLVTSGLLSKRAIIISTIATSMLVVGAYAPLRLAAPRWAVGVTVGLVNLLHLLRFLRLGSLLIGGDGANARIFLHASLEGILVLSKDRPGLVAACIASFVVVNAATLLLFRRYPDTYISPRAAIGLATAGAASFVIVTATNVGVGAIRLAINAYQHYTVPTKTSVAVTSAEEMDAARKLGLHIVEKTKKDVTVKVDGKPLNLIFIFLEAFNYSYTDFGAGPIKGLTPNVDRLAATGTLLKNLYGGAGWTMQGIPATLCGIYPDMAAKGGGNATFVERHDRYADLPCLPDILKMAGYKQVFFGGADSSFAGKGAFLLAHGYDDVRGWETWAKNPKYSNRRNTWGLNDDDLFAEGLDTIRALHAKGQPFNATFLTLNSHAPGYRFSGCDGFKGRQDADDLLDGIHCSDQALGAFVDGLQKDGILDDSLLVVVSDHKQFVTPKLIDLLGYSDANDQRIVGLILDPLKRLPSVVDTCSFPL